MRNTLIIMGSHPRTRDQFDFDRTDCDIIVFNEAARQPWVKRVDYVLQLHIPTIWRNPNNRNDPKHYEWLKTTNTPVFMQEKYEDIPAALKFPKDEVLAMLPNARANGKPIQEAACSPSWALAWGIYAGYGRIEIYGVELESNTEYSYQQGNFKYWLGVAAGRGVEVEIFSTMFDNPLYGYEGEVFIPYEIFGERVAEISTGKDELSERAKVAVDKVREESAKLLHGDNPAVVPAVQEAINHIVKIGEVDGAIQENQRYQYKADVMKMEGGNFVFSRQEFEHSAARHKIEVNKVEGICNAIKGQLDIYHGSLLMAAKGSPKREKILSSYYAKQEQLLQNYNKLGILRGAMNENFRYMARLDAGIKAAGGSKSEAAILEAAK